MSSTKCEIRCHRCKVHFPSPIQFGDAQSFFTSTLIGNIVTCPNCGKPTRCDKENMIFRAGDEGFLGRDARS